MFISFIFILELGIHSLCRLFFLFLVILCLGKLGDIRLGNEDEKPEFSFFSWLCMLFSAGMGNSSNRLSTRLSRNCEMEFPSTSRAVTIVRRPAGN
ncbi:BCCT family transporter [uncultured Megasphaera sp.]|uniref:BCCT family transporter n=1 Tax=uncultured Megasphaera sp. TaxID=165188 RepID=UPI00338D57D0